MLGGIAFQMGKRLVTVNSPTAVDQHSRSATITIYVFFATEFFVRYLKDAPFRRNQKGSAKKDVASEEKPEEGSIGIFSTDTATTAINGRSGDHYRGVMNRKLKVATAALIFSTVCLFIR